MAKRKRKPIYDTPWCTITVMEGTGAYKVSPKEGFNESYFLSLKEAAKYIGTTVEHIINHKPQPKKYEKAINNRTKG